MNSWRRRVWILECVHGGGEGAVGIDGGSRSNSSPWSVVPAGSRGNVPARPLWLITNRSLSIETRIKRSERWISLSIIQLSSSPLASVNSASSLHVRLSKNVNKCCLLKSNLSSYIEVLILSIPVVLCSKAKCILRCSGYCLAAFLLRESTLKSLKSRSVRYITKSERFPDHLLSHRGAEGCKLGLIYGRTQVQAADWWPNLSGNWCS